VRLADLLQSFGYVQHVTTATHTAGHILDLVIARIDTDISDVDVWRLHLGPCARPFYDSCAENDRRPATSQLSSLEKIRERCVCM